MRMIHTVTVEFDTTPPKYSYRKFFFISLEDARNFTKLCEQSGYKITGYGVEHFMTAKEAVSEIADDIEMCRLYEEGDGRDIQEYIDLREAF